MRKPGNIILLIIALFAIIATGVFFYKKANKPPIVYETKSPTYTDIVRKTVATGTVVPRKEIEIKPKVSGILVDILVVPGQIVKKGDVIAKIQIIPDMVSLSNAESRVQKAQIAYDDAKVVHDRQKQLFDKGVIAEADYLQAKLLLSNASAEIDAAGNNMLLIKEGATRKSGQTNTVVHSTIEGMVLDVPVKEGNSVIESNTFNAGTTIALVADMGEMIFEGKVDETEVGKIRVGMPLILTIGAIENTVFNAELEYISPKGIEENGAIQFEIRANVKLSDSVFVRAGYSANADIVLEKHEQVLTIEEGLIEFRNDSAFVQIETDEQKFEERYITTGISDGINIEVLSGLTEDNKLKGIEKKPEEEKEEPKPTE